jgi:hypothetical protein
LSVWILVGSLMPQNDMEEIAKIPALLAHFQEHKFSHPGESLSFSDFIWEHYAQTPCDNGSHEDLPFFKHNLPGLIFLIPKIQSSFCLQVFHLLPVSHAPDPEARLLSYSGQIWQPPKI